MTEDDEFSPALTHFLTLRMEPEGAIHPIGKAVPSLDHARARMLPEVACAVVAMPERRIVARTTMREPARDLFRAYVRDLPGSLPAARPRPPSGLSVFVRVRPRAETIGTRPFHMGVRHG